MRRQGLNTRFPKKQITVWRKIMAIYSEVLTYKNDIVKVLSQTPEYTKIEFLKGEKKGTTLNVFTKNLKVRTIKNKIKKQYELVIITNSGEDVYEIKTEKSFTDLIFSVMEKYCKEVYFDPESICEVIVEVIVRESGNTSEHFSNGYMTLGEVREETIIPYTLWETILQQIAERELTILENKANQKW